MARLVLTDASPLIGLARIDGLPWHGLQVAGTAAIIGMAKTRGLIASARQAFARLHGSDFRISARVIETVLARFGE